MINNYYVRYIKHEEPTYMRPINIMQIPKSFTILLLSMFFVSCTNHPNHSPPAKKLTLSPIFSDQMVLQQQKSVSIWGKSAPGETITVEGSWGNDASAITDKTGNWSLKLATPKAGGPYTVSIASKDNEITLKDVLVGEVWLASGQSNMSMPLGGWLPNGPIKDSAKEIAAADYPNIRMFNVTKKLSDKPLETLSGKWVATSPATAKNLSATAYFFARKLYQELNIPIGIIHSSWGGSTAEAWTNKEYLNEMGGFEEKIKELKPQASKKSIQTWFTQWAAQPVPKKDNGWQSLDFSDAQLATVGFDDSKWMNLSLPGDYDRLLTGRSDGVIWLRKNVHIQDTSTDYVLDIGAVDDMDTVYFNGQKVGGLVGAGFWNTPRKINIAKHLLTKGTNVIAIRAIDSGGTGAIRGPMTLTNEQGDTITLEGNWKSRIIAELFNDNFYTYGADADISARPDVFGLNQTLPTVLYNAMIAPLIPTTIRGVIWYQGEANVRRYKQYETLFPTLIANWRDKWAEELPFYFVQIAPYLYNANPNEQVSQALRDVQRHSLSIPKTGMAITLDIGNPNNIHPANKQDVGLRLAKLALAGEYDKNLVASGPLFQTAKQMGNKMIIEFSDVGSGLMSPHPTLTGFEIAGKEKVFVPAIANILDNKVVVSNADITHPQYVRYAWRDDAEATLFNVEGLPASSFTSD